MINSNYSEFKSNTFAISFVILLIVYYIYRLVFQKTKDERNSDYLFIAIFSSFIVPAFMTSTHENHFFLGSVLLILFLSKFKNYYIKLFCPYYSDFAVYKFIRILWIWFR